MKILIWTSSFYPVLGGVQTVTKTLCKELSAQGHEVILWTKKYPRHLKKTEFLEGIEIQRFIVNPFGSFFRFLPFKSKIQNVLDKILLRELQKKINVFQPDIINIHFPDDQTRLIKGLKIPKQTSIVTSIHGHDLLQWYVETDFIVTNRLRELNIHESKSKDNFVDLLNHSQSIIVCSKWMKDKTIELIGMNSKIHIIHNFIKPQNVHLDQVRTIAVKEKYIFAFGRLEGAKGFDDLVDVMSYISSIDSSIKLMIAGSGSQKSSLIAQAKRLGINDKVLFLGRISQKEIFQYSQQASVIVVPSKREAFGIAVLEAISSMKPFVARNVGGIKEAAGGFGELFDFSLSNDDLARLILRTSNKSVDYHELNGRKNYLDSKNPKVFIEKYMKVYFASITS